ncbi:myb-like protein X [Vespula squamosa]|uniref:Myb-like protein X n=1 Tax=Vespula squamosa TaxID=30214 RepID=A0ABD2BW89_VESSQ
MLVLKARLTRKKETKFIMAVTTNFDETNMTLFFKDLFEWWNEETAYFFRRIRKSAALARGYNKSSLERLSKDRLTMQAERGSNWNF